MDYKDYYKILGVDKKATQDEIKKVTTAVTVWCFLAVGCLAGGGYLIETFIATFVIIAINLFLKPVDEWLTKREIDGS